MNNYGTSFSGIGITIHFSDVVWNKWNENRQINSTDHECFGVLIGSCSIDLDEYWIESITTPFSQDNSSRFSFRLNDNKHQETVNQQFDSANGEQIYLGTWHTHPESHPTPSSIDTEDWQLCKKRNSGRRLFFVIVGTSETCVYSHQENNNIQLELMEKILWKT